MDRAVAIAEYRQPQQQNKQLAQQPQKGTIMAKRNKVTCTFRIAPDALKMIKLLSKFLKASQAEIIERSVVIARPSMVSTNPNIGGHKKRESNP